MKPASYTQLFLSSTLLLLVLVNTSLHIFSKFLLNLSTSSFFYRGKNVQANCPAPALFSRTGTLFDILLTRFIFSAYCINKSFPCTSFFSTAPKVRESTEFSRLSPATKTLPGSTVYGSRIPFSGIVVRPCTYSSSSSLSFT